MTRLTIAPQGGSVTFNGNELKPDQIDRMRYLLAGEIMAASTVGATKHADAAKTLLIQLTMADSECARWRAASSPTYRRTI